MRRLREFLVAVVLLAVVAAGTLLAIDNQTLVSLGFLGRESPAWPVSWWLGLAFAGGVLVGVGVCLASLARSKLRARRLNRALAQRERELDRLGGADDSGP